VAASAEQVPFTGLDSQALRAAQPSGLRVLRSRGRTRGAVALLGPAFVAAVAYVDPGNFATNFGAGAAFGYALAWTVAVANLMAMLVQYLSAKTGVATGRDLPELCREHLGAHVSLGLWVQAEQAHDGQFEVPVAALFQAQDPECDDRRDQPGRK